jgi:hypothetical protein
MANIPYMFWNSINSIVTYDGEVVTHDGDVVTVNSVFDKMGD